MEQAVVVEAIKKFLIGRGCFVSEQEEIILDSLDYLSLLLYMEETLHFQVDNTSFFSQGYPEAETLAGLSQRLFATQIN